MDKYEIGKWANKEAWRLIEKAQVESWKKALLEDLGKINDDNEPDFEE